MNSVHYYYIICLIAVFYIVNKTMHLFAFGPNVFRKIKMFDKRIQSL